MEFVESILDNSNFPVLSAFILGILTAISPCPLATNITAVGYLSKDIENKHKIFWGGILYTLGRIATYTIIGFVIIPLLRTGASIFSFQRILSEYGEILIGPILLIIGLYLLFGDKLNLPKFGYNGNINNKIGKSNFGAFLLGILFSLAFCPTSGIFYFGMLLPMAATTSTGFLLPIIFAIATGLPVIIVAWIFAYSISSISSFYNKTKQIKKILSLIIAILFILTGLYYLILYLS